MDSVEIQIMLFHQIKSQLPSHISLPEKLASLLDISIDSAYRRIRGEKELSFDELTQLCTEYNISVDQLLNLSEGKVLFYGKYFTPDLFNFENFLQNILKTLKQINSFDEKQLICQNKDISFFFYLMFPDMIAFKYFIWMKTHFQFPEFKNAGFSFDYLQPVHRKLISQINQEFLTIPSTEIMNPDNILTDLRQIEYFKVTHGFHLTDDMNRVYDSVDRMIDHIELIAKAGKKFLPDEIPLEKSQSHKIFVHDFHYGDNETVALVGENKITILTHSAINLISTNDKQFSEYSWDFMQNIIRKSTLISVTGEKARTHFFNLIRQRIKEFRTDKVKSLIH
jgi:hypothetical protein